MRKAERGTQTGTVLRERHAADSAAIRHREPIPGIPQGQGRPAALLQIRVHPALLRQIKVYAALRRRVQELQPLCKAGAGLQSEFAEPQM